MNTRKNQMKPWLWISVLIIVSASSEKILVVLPLVLPSHTNVFAPVISGLADKGHVITILSSRSLELSHENVTEFVVDCVSKVMNERFNDIIQLSRTKGLWYIMFSFPNDFAYPVCHNFLNRREVNQFLELNKTTDLIITSGFALECVMGFVHKYGVPYISIASSIWPNHDTAIGNYQQYSYIPIAFLDYSRKMNFYQRTMNILNVALFMLHRHFVYTPKMESLVRKHFGINMPPMDDIVSNVSIQLVNWDPSTGDPRSTLPASVPIGGINCRDPKPLPEELNVYTKSSGEHGFIYASLGTALPQSANLEELEDILLEAFSCLPQKVIWKKQFTIKKNISQNVKIVSWAPQQDLLGHPKIKAFLTHGGLFSTQEAVYHNVPTMIIPFWFDQHSNAARSAHKGTSIVLDAVNLSAKKVVDAFNEIINSTSYYENVKKLSTIMRDQDIHPKDRAVYWIEYVMRYKGTQHLRAASLSLSWYQAYMLDIVFFLLVLCSLIIIVSYYMLLKLITIARKIFNNEMYCFPAWHNCSVVRKKKQ